MSKPWLITIDLDGTTLTNEENGVSFEIPEYNIEVLNEARDRGHKVAIVTGRPWRDTKEIYKQLGFDTIVGNYNGAHIHFPHNEGFTESDATMNREFLNEINQTMFSTFFENFIIEDKENTFIYDMSDEAMLKEFHVEGDIKKEQISNDVEITVDPYSAAYKLKPGVTQEEVETELKAKYKDALNVRFWAFEIAGTYVELSLKSTHKAAAMEHMAAYYNIPMDRTLAIGDGANDIEMIEAAKIGVAMKNAKPQLIEVADEVTKFDNNEAGVGHYIKEFIDNLE